MKDRQHCTPLILPDSKSRAQRLYQIPFNVPPFREDRLQQLLAEHPEVIPIAEIEPAFSPLIFLGREVPAAVGAIDLLYISPTGYLTIVETKLWDNPEARRQVVAQIIDYATEITHWTFDELSAALKKSLQQNGEPGVQDILEIMKEQVGDFDETNFIDAVARNLSRGNFLLLVVGNGIREGVENISDYLQKTPGLHFSLALVELNLYRVNPEEDYPLYVQPRTLARTVELVRAVVDIQAPPDFKVNVHLPSETEVKQGKPRRRLSEEIFFEELGENTSEDIALQTRSLVEELQDLGLVSVWRSSSVSMRFPEPGGSGFKFTVIVFELSGSAYLGWLERVSDPAYGGYDENIALRYRNCVAGLVGILSEDSLELYFPIVKLFDCKDEFIGCVRRFISDLTNAASSKPEHL